MVTMDDISNAIILLVRIGAVARFVYCLVRLTAAEEQAAQYKKRARNTVIFYIIAESIWQIKDLILYYYSLQEVQMDEDLKLYIPLGVKPEAELFTGFGKKQLFQSIVGSLVMGGIAALAWLFTGNVTTTVILVLAGIFCSVMMTTKDQSNLSVVDQVQNLIRFLRGQKIYPYRYGDEWGLE